MSYKPDEKDWMAYLYGEMDEAEKQKFEEYLRQEPQAQQELERFQDLRSMLARMEEKEVIAPPIVVGEESGNGARHERRPIWNTPWFRIAAGLILIILTGKFTGLQVSASDHELRLSFGTRAESPEMQPVVRENTLTEADVQRMIRTSLDHNNDEIQQSLEETERKLDASIRKNLALSSGKLDHLVREASTASQEQIRQYVDGIRSENMQQVKDYFQLTSTEQKKYIENLLVDFAKYLQQQRNDDLRLVQMRMNNLEQNTDMFKQETEQILSSIITTVGVPVTGETRN